MDDLIKLYEIHEDYAIVLISGKRIEYYLYNTNCTKFLKGFEESLPNQFRKGGQSAQRLERIRDQKIGWYIKKITELMVQFYVADGQFKYKGLIIAGPAEMKQMVTDAELFIQYFEKNLLKTVTISEINDQSINQVIQMSSNVLSLKTEEQNLLANFEEKIMDPYHIDLFVFGNDQVLSDFHAGHLKELYLFDQSDYKDVILKANQKTTIHIIKSTVFVSKYGGMIGVKYYYSKLDSNEIENNDVVEV